MKPGDPGKQATIERVVEVYIALFPIILPGGSTKAETILAGYQRDPDHPGEGRVRATVETQASAVPNLINMCDIIVAEQEEIDSFRLLKFDSQGMHELNPADFRAYDIYHLV